MDTLLKLIELIERLHKKALQLALRYIDAKDREALAEYNAMHEEAGLARQAAGRMISNAERIEDAADSVYSAHLRQTTSAYNLISNKLEDLS